MTLKKLYPFLYIILICLIPYLFNGSNVQSPSKESKTDAFTVTLYRSKTKEIQKLPFEEYLCGVVAAEMQASFAPEALKAQAVAASSYTLYRYEYQKNNPDADTGHSGAFVCDDHTHCKSYLSKEDAKKKWGEEWYIKYYPNIESAVRQVYGQVITYDGKIINAVFHAISSGRTESAENVWGSAIPYLISVDSGVDTAAAGYETTASFSIDEAKRILKELGVTASGAPADWFTDILIGNAGSVQSVSVCGKTLKGTEVRKAFGLRSTAFTVLADDKNLRFTVRGYGHQVGMSQNGANALAEQGKSYTEILQHYYSGVKIESYNFEKIE